MAFLVKMTLNIDDSVMQCLREEAARQRRALPAPPTAGNRKLPPLPTWRSGGFRVDIANRDAFDRIG